MEVKQGSRVHQLKPIGKPNSGSHSAYHSLEKSQGAARHNSSEADILPEEGRLKRQLIRLRERVSELQDENVVLYKLKIEQENELSVWMGKARRLTEELRAAEDNNKNESPSKGSCQFLKNQVLLLQEQTKQLGLSKGKIEQQLKYEREKVQALQSNLQLATARTAELDQLRTRLADSEDLLIKTQTAFQRSQARGTRGEMYITQLEGELQYLGKQLQQQLGLLQEQTLSQLNEENAELKSHLDQTVEHYKKQQSKNEQLSVKVQEMSKTNNRMKEDLVAHRGREEAEGKKRQSLLEQFEKLQSQFQALRQENQSLRNKQVKLSPAEANLRTQNSGEVQQMKQEIDRLRAKVSDKQVKIAEMAQQREKIQMQMARSEKENDKFRQINEELKVKLVDMETAQQSKTLDFPVRRQLFIEEERSPLLTYQSLRGNHQIIEPSQVVLKAEVEALEKRIREMRILNQQLTDQLERAQQQEQQRREQEEIEVSKCRKQLVGWRQLNIQLQEKVRNQEDIIAELRVDNQKWKSYRQSEEDQARREVRRYKQLVQEIQFEYKKIVGQMERELNEKKDVLEEAQIVCQNLKKQMMSRQDSYSLSLEKEKQVLSRAMDDMQAEFRAMMKDCELQIQEKQNELDLQHKQFDHLALALQEERSKAAGQTQAKHLAEHRIQELLQQLADIQKEIQKVQGLARRQSDSTRVIISEAQEEVRMRYEKSTEDKVLQIQRLKLQLQEEERAGSSLSRQLQLKDNSLKTLQREIDERNDRVHYLQRMMESYEGEAKAHKKVNEELLNQINEGRTALKGLQKELVLERCKVSNYIEQSNNFQSEIKKQHSLTEEWKEKYLKLLTDRDRNLSDVSTREKGLKTQIRELQNIIQERVRAAETLNIQCQKFQHEVLSSVERQKLLRKQLQETKSKNNYLENKSTNLQKLRAEEKQYLQTLISEKNEKVKEMQSQKQYIQTLHFEQQTHLQQIEELQRSILYLNSEKEEKVRQIQLLLEKIDQYDNEYIFKAAKNVQGEEVKKAVRLAGLEKMSRLAGIPLIEEEGAIRGISDWAHSLSVKSEGLEEEVREYKKIVVSLRQENESLTQKYMKYKGIVLEYKEKRDREKLAIKNNYRFNEEVLTHCQNIIKGANK